MKTLCVLQHVEAEYLGLMEDHLESRSIRFVYCRPFVPGGQVPENADGYDGLVLLGAGPLGIVSGPLIPSLGPELRLARDFLARGLPVVGIGVGAALLATAAGGGADEAPLRFAVETATRSPPHALAGHLPERFPAVLYLRDAPFLPEDAAVLATSAAGGPLLFQVRDNCLGFLGHPGAKAGMIEDLIMEFPDAPDDCAETLGELRAVQGDLAAALTDIMVGLVQITGLMRPE